MNETGKRLVMLFVGVIPTIIAFWLTLWFWVDARPEFVHDAYFIGWVIMILVLVGVPCIIFAVMTCSMAFADKRDVDRDYETVMCMVRGTRTLLSRRIAPPVESENKEETRG